MGQTGGKLEKLGMFIEVPNVWWIKESLLFPLLTILIT